MFAISVFYDVYGMYFHIFVEDMNGTKLFTWFKTNHTYTKKKTDQVWQEKNAPVWQCLITSLYIFLTLGQTIVFRNHTFVYYFDKNRKKSMLCLHLAWCFMAV